VETPGADHSTMIVQTIGLVVGWIIVHRLSKARDLEKERRALVATAAAAQVQKINELLVDASRYHRGPRDVSLEQQIKMALQDVAENVNALNGVVRDTAAIKSALRTIRELRMAITGHHFEDEHSGPVADPNDVLEAIALAGLNSKRGLLILQHAEYRNRKS
jgi:hypothetical protein